MTYNLDIRIYDDEIENYGTTTIISNEKKDYIIFDPSHGDRDFVQKLEKKYNKLKGIFLTHGHVDHIRGVKILHERNKKPIIYCHPEEEVILTCADYNLSSLTQPDDPIVINQALEYLRDGAKIHIEGFPDIYVIYTPFHTVGSVCYYIPEMELLIAGDTLFNGGVGRSDLIKADPFMEDASLYKLILLLEQKGDMKVITGHGPGTRLSYEINTQPIFKRVRELFK